MTPELQKKVDQAVKLLQVTASNDVVEVSYSGGKDSDVILELARMSGIKYRAIYKNTTIDPPGTIAHAKENGAEIIRPKKTFFELIAQKGYPSRFVRFCCSELKEYKDVAAFIAERGIKCHPLYYDEQGNFHAERRLGCMCCPLIYRKRRIEEFAKRPGMVKAYIRAGQKYRDTHPDAKFTTTYDNIYDAFCRFLFFDSQGEWEQSRQGIFEPQDSKKFLEDYFKITF